MNTSLPLSRLLAFALPASLGPLALGLASVWVLHQAPRQPLVPEDEDAPAITAEVAEKRIYLPLILPITVSLPNGRGRLSIELGIAMREEGSVGLMSRLSERQQEAQAGLAEAALRTAESVGQDTDLEALRAALPPALRETLNDRLIAMGEEPAILEILITAWAHVP